MLTDLAAVFVALYAAHHLGDHIVQTDWQARHKTDRGWVGVRAMAGHLAGYHLAAAAALAAVTAFGADITWAGAAAGLGFSAATHAVLDRRWPVQWLLEHTGSAAFADRQTPICGMYEADQSLHVAALFVAALITVAVP